MLKVAVIGVGSIGQHHARVYTELPSSELVAVSDVNAEVGSCIGQKFSVPSYTNFEEMLAKHKPDAVSISVPTALHEQVATKAMQFNAHVLIEKPIASTVEEGKRLIKLAKELNRQIMVGHIVRFNPATQLLKQKLKAGELGQIYQIVCRRIGPFPARIRDVGVVIDLAPHDLDLMRFLLDADPLHLFAEIGQNIHTDHEDMVLGMLHFPQGIKACLEINWLTPTKVREVIVLGERGLFRVDDLTQDLYFYENGQANGELWGGLKQLKGVSEGKMIRFDVKRQEPLKAELSAFIDSILHDIPVPVNGLDGLAALNLSLALIKSGKNHQVVKLS